MIKQTTITLWNFRSFIWGSVKREFQAKYRGSLLGALWAVANPLAMIVVYTVIFSSIMHARLPGVVGNMAYSIYLCVGIFTWGFFSETVFRAQGVFLEHASIMKKANFPRICLPVIALVNTSMNFALVFTLFLIFLVVSGNFPGLVILNFIPLLAIQILFAMGLGTALGVLNVFFRDVGHFTTIFFQFWFWLTPIVYPITILPERYQGLISFNPMARLMEAYHQIFVSHMAPDWASITPVAIVSLLLCVLALHMFRAHSGEMMDEL